MTSRRVQEELNKWIEAREDVFTGENRWVTDVKWDTTQWTITMKVDMDFSEEFSTPVVVLVPETYPRGIYNVTYMDVFKEMKGADVGEVLDELLDEMEQRRLEAMEDEGTPMSDVLTPNDWEEERTNPSVEIESDLKQVIKVDGYTGMYKGSGVDEIRVYLMFDPQKKLKISELVANAWGIDMSKWITVALTFSSHYLNADEIPAIDAFQCGRTDSLDPATILEGKVLFGLYWTVQERLKSDFFKKHWPHEKYELLQQKTGKNYMRAVLDFTVETIISSPGRCIVCGNKLSYEGLKPTVCDSPLCIFSHEQYGLGVDLESAIRKNPEIVDLMITMTFAASAAETSRFNPFNPFPLGLEVKLKGTNGRIDTYNFANSKGEKDNSKVKAVLEKIPPVSTLSTWVDEGKLQERCNDVDPLLYSLLRWILASNRSHLKKLAPSEQIKEMNTTHQYILLSSPPAREKRFQELKKQHTSVYGFHGSALGNWHAIMRNGLENMSGKAGQAHGAAYGSGVYLAPNSNVSFSYMKYMPGWKHSMFKSSTLGCMAMCEIIKHPSLKGQPNPYYVVPNEEYLATRYFFVYTATTNASVDGAKVKPPPVTW